MLGAALRSATPSERPYALSAHDLEYMIDEASTVAPEAHGTTDPSPDDGGLGERAARTRSLILKAAQQLFLDRGYSGTRINNITDACGISRAGFYTYFKDKREVFNLLGEESYRDILATVTRWDDIPHPASRADVERWVTEYFAFMDVHGAFIFSSAQSAPPDEDFRESSKRLQMRVAWLLGVNLRNRQTEPTEAPEALGLAVMAMLDRSWYQCRVQRLPVDDGDMIATVAAMIRSTIRTND
jgi:TetR/AcrR family transcriptional regulator